MNFLRAGKKLKISNFIGWFYLKDKLTEQKIDTPSFCPDSKDLLKVSAKSISWFTIQLKKIRWFFLEQARKSKFQISSVGFVWKMNWLSKKLTQQVSLLKIKSFGKFQQNLTASFQLSRKKLGEFLRAGKKVKNSNFIGCFSLKEKFTKEKIHTAVSCPESKELLNVSAKSKP